MLGEREPPPLVAVGEREVLGIAVAARADEQIAQAPRARLEHLHPLAEHVGLFQLERATRPEQLRLDVVLGAHAGRTIAMVVTRSSSAWRLAS